MFFNPSTTVSNKIVIGAEDVDLTTPPPSAASPTTASSEDLVTAAPPLAPAVTPQRNFPSFPIRGDTSDLFKPKLDFSRKTKSSFKFSRQPETPDVEEKEESVTEQSDIAPTEQSVTEPETTSKRFFVDLTGGRSPRVKSNQLFNKRKRPDKERFRLKLAQLQATATTAAEPATATDPVTEEATEPGQTLPTPAPAANKFKIRNRKKPLTFFGKVPDVSFTNTLLKFRNRNKAFGGSKRTTTAAAITSQDNTEADATTTETPASVLSVEAELAEEEPQQKVTIGTKFPTVRKANKAPANGNIRVEFKKQVDTQTGARGKFFIKPDGRKPRVKSNIRAKFAHRGQHFGQIPAAAEDTAPGAATSSEEETFDGASSQLDLTPFNKVADTDTDKAAAEGVNTEKREVNNAEAPNKVSAAPALPAVAAPAQFSHELPLFPLQPVILNPRQQRTERPPPPPLPAAILNHINHITDIRSLPPLPPLFRNKKKQVSKVKKQEAPPSEEKVNEAHKDIITPPATNPTSSLLEQLVEGETSAAPPSPAPALSSSAVAPASESPSSSVTNKLSAFRALQQQVEKKEAESSLTLV